MAKARTVDATDQPVAEVTEDVVTDFPEWATRAPEESEVVPWTPPAANQHRRKLTGPELMSWISDQAKQSTGFDEASIAELFANVAGAVTLDDLFAGSEAVKGRMIHDVMLRVDNIRFMSGRFADGCPYFAILYVVRTDTNKKEVVSTGGWRAIAQLGQMHYLCAELPEGSPYLMDPSTEGAVEKWGYPQFMRIKESEETANGYTINYIAGPGI
jgi:hypothetical protein